MVPLQCIVLQLQQDTTAISKPLPQMKNICAARYHQEEMGRSLCLTDFCVL